MNGDGRGMNGHRSTYIFPRLFDSNELQLEGPIVQLKMLKMDLLILIMVM